jgi:hypothetical protein
MYRDGNIGREDATLNTPDNGEMAQKYLDTMSKSYGGYVWGARGGGGAHAMAFFRSPGQLDLFDANYGQFRFADESAHKGVKWFLDKCGYHDGLGWESKICLVNEPYSYPSTTTDNYTRPTNYRPFVFTTLASLKIKLAHVEVDWPPLRRPKGFGRALPPATGEDFTILPIRSTIDRAEPRDLGQLPLRTDFVTPDDHSRPSFGELLRTKWHQLRPKLSKKHFRKSWRSRH